MKENYERWMNREIQRFQARGEVPRLLLHSCCAPCSSAVLESVFRYFEITIFYYNPNIFPKEEYLHRVQAVSYTHLDVYKRQVMNELKTLLF